jgi:predicted nucleotidyltransferase
MTESERESVFTTAREILLAALPDAWAIYAYGSFARGEEWPDSDLDLAVLLPPGQQIPDKLELLGRISRQVHREVDLVSLRDAGLDLARELLRDGKPLIIRREADTLAWEAERMTDYAQFNPRRAEIVNAYMREPLRAPT